MANVSERWDDNLAGSWYVDNSCIVCGLCSQLAPENFKEADAGDHDIVFKQPEGDEELQACQDAMEQCPVDAIGNDG